ncbi:hypothetical protein AB0O20_01960 [Streptomyces kronopolitis]|uniref:hypothetical protein n=1 Tax=Streptomyces kronopolitis TaxID=1612435 RepID=UPI00341D6941
MNAPASRSDAEQIWYLATLGREALLRSLAPLGLSSAVTHDPLSLATHVVTSTPGRAIHQIGQAVLQPLLTARAFTVTVTSDDIPTAFTGVVPVIGEHTAGGATGLYAELLLFSMEGLSDKAAFRLSRMPTDKTWIIDTDFRPTGHPDLQRPFGSSRMGRKRAPLALFSAELDRLAAELNTQGSST